MSPSILAPTSIVYEYSFSLINPADQDIQSNLTAAFIGLPTEDDWVNWLSGWSSIGYSFFSQPLLINVLS